ncbi:MAG TPA: DNA recombination protein RmuC [Xanthobacteraceae bacterium]|nr:DNA recombination protein RmuC [Xanthobacteraceae bacterium]
MSDIVFMIGVTPVTVAEILLAIGAAALLLLLALAIGLWRSGKQRAREADEQTARADEFETRISELVRAQTEMSGRVQSFAELVGGRQAELARTVTERLDSVSHRLGEGMSNAARATVESLGQLHERIAVVDAAQNRLAELSSHLVTLKDVLANKQSRGAFGQGRMEAIVSDGLPKDAFAFQHTLSNGKRPDCVVFLPGDARPLVIDAKFPLESITAFREAKGEAERRACGQRLRQDITKHVADISERYLLHGETQDMALMFVPSESLYAEIHENFDDLMQRAFRARVLLVSPSLLMLAIQVLQVIVKDARMQEQAEVIRNEVGKLMEDVARLRDRALNLQKHFAQTSDDIAQLLISTDKVVKRGARIEALEFEEESGARKRPEIPAPLGLKLGAAE